MDKMNFNIVDEPGPNFTNYKKELRDRFVQLVDMCPDLVLKEEYRQNQQGVGDDLRIGVKNQFNEVVVWYGVILRRRER